MSSNRQADVAIVLAGDALTRTMYEWFEAAGALSGVCFDGAQPPAKRDGFVPGESASAVVMESDLRARGRGAAVYAGFRSGFMTANPKASASAARRALADSSPSEVRMIVASANGSRELDAAEEATIAEVFGGETPVIAPKAFLGESDSGGILRLIAALSWAEKNRRALAFLLGSSSRGCAAISFDLP